MNAPKTKPGSLMRRIEAFFTAAPDEELTMDDVRTKFECTFDQAVMAVRNLRREGMVIRFRFGRVPVLRASAHPHARGVQKRNPHARGVQIVVRVPASPFQGIAESARVASEPGSRPPVVIERSVSDGSTTVTRIAPQETEEWQERERQRRARQRPPKPTKTAKTRGRKLLEMIGVDDGA
jgi:hypothetical protein